jgi:type IV pilus assembly protein PilM
MFNRSLIAIDIGSSAVKVVELGGSAQQRKLKALGLELLPQGVVVDGAILDVDAVTGALRSLVRRLRLATVQRRAAIGLSGSGVFIKKVRILPTKDSTIEDQVVYEAEQQFQHDIADLCTDFYQMGPPLASGEVQMLLVGAKRDVVDQYLGIVNNLGLRTGVVDCQVFSIANMFEFNYGTVESIVGIVNVGASSCQLSLVSKGEYLYTRDIPIGGDEYTRRIMEIMNVDRENAEALKISASSMDAGTPAELSTIIQETNEQLVSEIQGTITYFFQSGEAPADAAGISHLFMTGGSSKVSGFDAALAATLQLPVQIVNPFHRIEVNPRLFPTEDVMAQSHIYGVAVGLAMRATGDRE